MRATSTDIPDVLVVEPSVLADARGSFMETFNVRAYSALGITAHFVQDNQSCSRKGVLRGLHYQVRNVQGKLVRVIRGEVFDVAVDLRRSSATFGKWAGHVLSEDNNKVMWIPPGFAHGFLALAEGSVVAYKVTDYYLPEGERTIHWADPDLRISWPINEDPILSRKDSEGVLFRMAEMFS